MIVIRETHILRITIDLSVLLISAGMCKAISYDFNASKMPQI